MAGPADAHKPPHKAAKPQRTPFDPWNSSSTGHQRADNTLSGSTAWRASRTLKLAAQLADPSATGGKRVADTVGAGSEAFGSDGRAENGGWVRGASGLRPRGQLSLWECHSRGARPSRSLGKTLKAADTPVADKPAAEDYPVAFKPASPADAAPRHSPDDHDSQADHDQHDDHADHDDDNPPPSAQPAPKPTPRPTAPPAQIFRGVTVYINGSTHPLISDHKLRRLLATHGAHLSLTPARRTVTHVVLGSAGGALAAGKLQREIAARAGRVRFVRAAWVVESVRAGRRLGEAPFAGARVAAAGQAGVRGAFA